MNEQWTDWKRRVLDPLLADPPGRVDPDAPVAILSADADRVHDYVFESARLPDIRGGSMLLQGLNDEVARLVKRAVDPDCVIYAGGGSLLAIVPDDADLLTNLRHEIEALYPERTGAATTTCITYRTTAGELLDGYGTVTLETVNALRQTHPADWARIAACYGIYGQDGNPASEISREDFEAHRGFGQMVKLAGVALRRRKDNRPLTPFHEALPHAQRCRSCGLRPATLMGRLHEEHWPLCEPCVRKMEKRYADRSHWLEEYSAFLAEHPDLGSGYYVKYGPGEVGISRDLGEIGQACKARGGYVGFIYADGNSVGRLLETRRTIAEFRQVSQTLEEVTADAVYQALAELVQPAKVEREQDTRTREDVVVHPFEIITIGGDDVLLIVPGDVALPLAVRICELFSAGMADFQLPDGGPVTMSVGLVIADSHNPVRALRDVAEQLLKRGAKRRAHDERAPALDFLVLKSQSMLRRDIDNLRATYPIKLPGEGARNALRLTSAPYTLEEAKALLHLLRQMRLADFPTSQLQRLVEALHEGRERGSLFFLYQQARLHKRETGAILAEIERTWHFDEKKDPIPWNRVKHDPDVEVAYTSILPDLADLYDFVPSREEIRRWNVVLGGGE